MSDNKQNSFEQIASEVKEAFKAQGSSAWPLGLQSKLYGLYTQATKGDATYESKPYPWQLIQLQKWTSWDKEKGKTREEAGQEYAELGTKVLSALENHGDLSQLA